MKLLKPLLAVGVGVAAFAAGSLIFHHSSNAHQPVVVSQHLAGASYPAGKVTSPPQTADDLLRLTEAQLGMDMSRATDRGHFGSGTDAVHLVTAPTNAAQSCLLSDSPGGPASSCLSGGDLFAQHKVVYLVQSDGGPDPSKLKYLRVVGVAASDVDSLQVIFKSGATHRVDLNVSHAFDYEAPLGTIRSGDVLTTLVAYSNGTTVGTFPLSQQ